MRLAKPDSCGCVHACLQAIEKAQVAMKHIDIYDMYIDKCFVKHIDTKPS